MFLHCVLFSLDFPKNSATQEDIAIANSKKYERRLELDNLLRWWQGLVQSAKWLNSCFTYSVMKSVASFDKTYLGPFLGTRSSQDLLFIFRDKICTRGTGIGARSCSAYCIELNWCWSWILLCLLGIRNFIKPSLRSNESSFPLTSFSKKLPLLIKMHVSWFSGKLLQETHQEMR